MIVKVADGVTSWFTAVTQNCKFAVSVEVR